MCVRVGVVYTDIVTYLSNIIVGLNGVLIHGNWTCFGICSMVVYPNNIKKNTYSEMKDG